MYYLSQISIIAFISFLGELLNRIIPLPVPGSIYGLVIMLACLILKIIKPGNVRKTGNFLISLMPLMFIGPVVGLMTSYSSYKNIILPVVVISLVTTIITMVVTGKTAQYLIHLKQKKRKGRQQ